MVPVTIARIIVFNKDNKILLLKKSKDSKQAGKFELPGGKVESKNNNPTDTEIINTAVKELQEETEINSLNTYLKKLNYSYTHSFRHHSSIIVRNSYFFLLKLNHIPQIQIGNTLKANSQSEDNHDGYVWVDVIEYEKMRINAEISSNSCVPVYFIND